MIRYSLICASSHEFEAWFASSEAYEQQEKRGQLSCPLCGDSRVARQIAAPAVRRTDRPTAPATAVSGLTDQIAALKAHIAETFEDVGEGFAEEARAIHAGEAEARPILGQATAQAVRDLKAEGVPVAPLPDALVPRRPDRLN